MSDHHHGTEATTAVGPAGNWTSYKASAIGADHVRAGAPNQDAVATGRPEPAGGGGQLVFAVADGHGHSRHFRSARGSRLAVATGVAVASKWLAALPAGTAVSRAAAGQLVLDVVSRWREAVATDLADDPISDGKAATLPPDDPPEIPYGSTLLLAVVRGDIAVLAQIGDGEIILVRPDGRHLVPIPDDSRLDGTQTTSLCQPDAVSAFRVALVNLAKTPIFAIFAATDGYGNAQANENWRPDLAADLVSLGIEHSIGWLGEQLDGWAALCASSDGSGDDSTIALGLNAAAMLTRPPRQGRRPFFGAADAQTQLPSTLRLDQTALTQTNDLPAVPAAPAVPGALDVPGQPDAPGTIRVPGAPGAPGQPDATRMLGKPGVAGAPGWPGAPPPATFTTPPPRPPWANMRVLAGAAVLVVAGVVAFFLLQNSGSSVRPTFSPGPGHPSHTVRPTPRPTGSQRITPKPSPTARGKATPTPSHSLGQATSPKPSASTGQGIGPRTSPTPTRTAKPKAGLGHGAEASGTASAASAGRRGAAQSIRRDGHRND
jgi:hypothetical protein